MWLATQQGLYQFDRTTETFTDYQHAPSNPNSLSDSTIVDVVQDRQNPDIFWVGTLNGGLNKFDHARGRVTHYEHNPNDPNTVAHPEVWRIVQDYQNPHVLWLGTWGGGLNKFDTVTETFTHFQHDPENSNSFLAKDNIVLTIAQDKDNPDILWLGSLGGLERFEISTQTFTHYIHLKEAPNTPLGTVSRIYDDGKGTLWLAGWLTDNGLTFLDKTNLTFTRYRHQPDHSHTLSENGIAHIYREQSGIYWIVSRTGKVDKYDSFNQNFRLHRSQNTPTSLSNNLVQRIYQDQAGTIWIGTFNGLNQFVQETETFTHYQKGSPVTALFEDTQGTFWFSISNTGDLSEFDRRSGQIIQSYPSQAASIFTIQEDPDNPDLLWLGTAKNGLGTFNKQSKTFSFYTPDPNTPNAMKTRYVQLLTFDSQIPVVWAVGGSGGLIRFDRSTESFTHYFHDADEPNSISDNDIQSIYAPLSTPHILWIGGGGGLNKFDKYIGDAIMALFPTKADDALQSALAMLDKLKEYNQTHPDKQDIHIGIGIHTGTLMLGTVGGPNRMDSTVISDAVNLAARTESLTKAYGAQVLLTENTYRQLNNLNRYTIRRIDEVTVKGKSQPVVIYEVLEEAPESERMLPPPT